MSHTESEILAALTGSSHDVDELFIVDGLIMAPPEPDGFIAAPSAFLIEDDALAKDCVDYLRSRGAKSFETIEEWMAANGSGRTWYEPGDPTPTQQCPCCDYISLHQRGKYLICPICFWEDEGQDLDRIDEVSGPNGMTLRAARENFDAFGACDQKMVEHTLRPEDRVHFERRSRRASGKPA